MSAPSATISVLVVSNLLGLLRALERFPSCMRSTLRLEARINQKCVFLPPPPFRNSSTLRTYTSAKSATGRRVSINSIASSTFHPIEPRIAKAIIGARCTPAAQWINTLAPGSSSATCANCTPRRNSAAGLGSKSSSVGFQSTSTPCSTPKGVSSNSICLSMICVTPVRATLAIFSDVQIPPPTAIRSVNQVISIPFLRGAGNPARPNMSSAAVRPLFELLFGEPLCLGTRPGETENDGRHRITLLCTFCLILEYPQFRVSTTCTGRSGHRHYHFFVDIIRLRL